MLSSNPNVFEAGKGGSQVQGQLWLHSEHSLNKQNCITGGRGSLEISKQLMVAGKGDTFSSVV